MTTRRLGYLKGDRQVNREQQKTIIKPQYAANGGLHFNFVLPTANLRALVKAHLLASYPTLNYCCEWKDVRGHGLMLAVADWKTTAGVYHVPN